MIGLLGLAVVVQLVAVERGCEDDPWPEPDPDTQNGGALWDSLRDPKLSDEKRKLLWDSVFSIPPEPDNRTLSLGPINWVDSVYLPAWDTICPLYINFIDRIAQVCETSDSELPPHRPGKSPGILFEIQIDTLHGHYLQIVGVYFAREWVSNRSPLEIVSDTCLQLMRKEFHPVLLAILRTEKPGSIQFRLPKNMSQRRWCCEINESLIR